MQYRTGYRYQLAADERFETMIIGHKAGDRWFDLDFSGSLNIIAGYAWDGPSGPAIDTASFMRASLVHDVLYQMMRQELLPLSARDSVDNIMRQICLADGMSKVRAWYTYNAVRMFAADAASPTNAKPVKTAP